MNPCYKCENRTAECHATCRLYLDWETEERERKSKAYKLRNDLGEYCQYRKEICRKERRRHGR